MRNYWTGVGPTFLSDLPEGITGNDVEIDPEE